MTLAGLLFRWLHILAAGVAIGSTFLAWGAVLPAAGELPEATRRDFLDAVRKRWAKFVHATILILLVSGFYNFFFNNAAYDLPKAYHMLFGIKFLLALAVFFVASMLHGRSGAALAFRQNAHKWAGVNVLLLIVIVCLSGYMRSLPHEPKAPAIAEPSANQPA